MGRGRRGREGGEERERKQVLPPAARPSLWRVLPTLFPSPPHPDQPDPVVIRGGMLAGLQATDQTPGEKHDPNRVSPLQKPEPQTQETTMA